MGSQIHLLSGSTKTKGEKRLSRFNLCINLFDLFITIVFASTVGLWGAYLFFSEIQITQNMGSCPMTTVLWLLFINSMVDIVICCFVLIEIFSRVWEHCTASNVRRRRRLRSRGRLSKLSTCISLVPAMLTLPSAALIISATVMLYTNSCSLKSSLYNTLNIYLFIYWTYTILKLMLFTFLHGCMTCIGLRAHRRNKLHKRTPEIVQL